MVDIDKLTLIFTYNCKIMLRENQRYEKTNTIQTKEDIKAMHEKTIEVFFVNSLFEPGALQELSKRPLKRMVFTNCGLTDNQIHFLNIPTLTRLQLYGNKIGDSGAAIISRFSSLTWLNLGDTGLTSRGVRHLEKLTKLTHLFLNDNSIGDSGARSLAKLRNLVALESAYCRIGDEGAGSLAKLRNLQELYFYGNFIGNSGASKLAKIPKMRNLSISYNLVTEWREENIRDFLASKK